jgi:hypothetical protein
VQRAGVRDVAKLVEDAGEPVGREQDVVVVAERAKPSQTLGERLLRRGENRGGR